MAIGSDYLNQILKCEAYEPTYREDLHTVARTPLSVTEITTVVHALLKQKKVKVSDATPILEKHHFVFSAGTVLSNANGIGLLRKIEEFGAGYFTGKAIEDIGARAYSKEIEGALKYFGEGAHTIRPVYPMLDNGVHIHPFMLNFFEDYIHENVARPEEGQDAFSANTYYTHWATVLRGEVSIDSVTAFVKDCPLFKGNAVDALAHQLYTCIESARRQEENFFGSPLKATPETRAQWGSRTESSEIPQDGEILRPPQSREHSPAIPTQPTWGESISHFFSGIRTSIVETFYSFLRWFGL